MYNQRLDPPSWAIELPGSGTSAERPTAQNGVPQASFMRPLDQRPALLAPRPPALEDDSRPSSAAMTGPETPRWQCTISPVTLCARTEDLTRQRDAQSLSNSRPNFVRMRGHPKVSVRCTLTISRFIGTRGQTRIQDARTVSLLALPSGKTAMVESNLGNALMK
jgi:hypothetical protein